MDARSYVDFDLVIEQAGDKYRARVVNSPAGQAAIDFDSLFSPLELENFVLRMGRPQRGMRRFDSSEMASVKAFGARLFQTVFKDDVYACYLRSLDDALDENNGLRIRLRIDVPAFHDLPWEFLYDRQVDQFLALSKDTPIVRYMELPYGTQALPVKSPMKILVMISSPEGYPPLQVEEEWRRLNRAVKPLIDRGLVVLKRLEKPTLGALQQHLRREQTHVFHYIGHGKYFEPEQDGMLLLEDEDGRGRPTSGQHLGTILHDHHTLRLVVLNACEGARTSSADPYTGVAQTLVRQGIPAVLAMQFEIFEEAAITLVQEFYGAISDGYPVDAALSEARKAIFASGNDVEWGTPVLFMRIPNGVLFRPGQSAEKTASATDLQPKIDEESERKISGEAAEGQLRERPFSPPSRPSDQAGNQIVHPEDSPQPESPDQARGKHLVAESRTEPLEGEAADRSLGRSLRSGRRPIFSIVIAAVLVLLAGGYVLLRSQPKPAATATQGTDIAVVDNPAVLPSQTLQPAPPTQTPSPENTPNQTPEATYASKIAAEDGMSLHLIPAGTFTMGSNARDDEKPPHEVELLAFWIDETEVTNEMYAACVATGMCAKPIDSSFFSNPAYKRHPVVFVRWEDARAYCEWAGRRLPTEAEWEKAARGTDKRAFPWGNAIPTDLLANFGRTGTTAVGRYPMGASPYGALDMTGNVWEWVSSLYKRYPYNFGDGRENMTSTDDRVLRGSSWFNDISNLRLTYRGRSEPDDASDRVGFRCASSAE